MFSDPLFKKEDIEEIVKLIKEKKTSIKDGSGVIGEFERDFASFHKREYALAMNSGTAALHSALFALDLKPGSEVLLPAFGFHADVTPMISLGLKPVFCNVDKNTYNIDPEDIKNKFTENTKAIIVLHLFGHPADMNPILKLASKHNIRVIEDASHSFGAEYKGRKVGTFGDIACFSLQKSKAISAGEGGILITDSKEYLDRAILLGHPARKISGELSKFDGISLGFKYRPDPLAISLAKGSLGRINGLNQMRGEVWAYYDNLLKGVKGIILPYTSKDCKRGGYFGYRLKYDSEVMKISKISFLKELKKHTEIFFDESFLFLPKLKTNNVGILSFSELISSSKKEYTLDDSLSLTEDLISQMFYIDFPRRLSEENKKIISHDITMLKSLLSKYLKN